MDTSTPPLRDLKGPGLLATYRIAYLKNKLLLLKAMTVKEKKKEKKRQNRRLETLRTTVYQPLR